MHILQWTSIFINLLYHGFYFNRCCYFRPKVKKSIQQYFRCPEEKTNLPEIFTFHWKRRAIFPFKKVINETYYNKSCGEKP